MDITSSNCFEVPTLFPSHEESQSEVNVGLYKTITNNPFVDSFCDPLCKLNLKETSEFVKSFTVANNGTEGRAFLQLSAQRRREGFGSVAKGNNNNNVEAPSTPGRPIFGYGAGNLSKKSFPSKWDDAEKWLISGSSCQDSPAHPYGLKPCEPSSKVSKHCSAYLKQTHQAETFSEKSRVTEEKFSKAITSFHGSSASLYHHHHHHHLARDFNGVSDVLLKDKFTNEVEPTFPKFKCSEPMKEGFLFGKSVEKSMKDAATEVVPVPAPVPEEVKHRDAGTEMTPLGSSTTSRCHTPFKSSSPARHNTPASRSGPLALMNSNITQLQECNLAAKLQLGTRFDSVASNWSSREEEEEDISKSLRHFEINTNNNNNNECRKSVSDIMPCSWEEEEKTKCCLRFHREEAKIQAWINLQNAKAEAQSRKLEVKIQKMRSNLEEKLMRRMVTVHRKAEDWRAAARLQHSEQIQRAAEQAQKMIHRQHSLISGRSSCGCFPPTSSNSHLL